MTEYDLDLRKNNSQKDIILKWPKNLEKSETANMAKTGYSWEQYFLVDIWKNCIKHIFKFAKFFLICIKITVYQSIFLAKIKVKILVELDSDKK